ncbi:MAG: hypothetical protein KDD64_08720 [Bdellovibrionales bacterium]|nr:hypothetical protein [Bdellovibrionales bacterium]
MLFGSSRDRSDLANATLPELSRSCAGLPSRRELSAFVEEISKVARSSNVAGREFVPLTPEKVSAGERPLLSNSWMDGFAVSPPAVTFVQIGLSAAGLVVKVQSSFHEGTDQFRDGPDYRALRRSDLQFFSVSLEGLREQLTRVAALPNDDSSSPTC